MSAPKIAIIGAGMAGLGCARILSDAGLHPVVFDKGRGIGGRLATRRAADGLQFDHGAQYLTAKAPAFATVLARMQAAGAAALWADNSGRDHVVGVPGMSGIAKHLGQGLDVRQNAELLGLSRNQTGWLLTFADADLWFEFIVLTMPAPQVLRLLGQDHAFAPSLSTVGFTPCLTLMAAFAPAHPPTFLTRRSDEGPLSWIACDSSKPGRNVKGAWVAQASPAWSRQNLDCDMTDIADRLLPILCQSIGLDVTQATHREAHRWRYALAAAPLGAPFLSDATGTLFAGGDWCIGARAEAAWTSGKAIADELLQRI